MVFKRSRKDAMLLTERCQRYTIIGHDKVLRMERGGGAPGNVAPRRDISVRTAVSVVHGFNYRW